MVHIDEGDADTTLSLARRQARHAAYVQNTQLMLVAAAITAFCLVAVAGAMLATLL